MLKQILTVIIAAQLVIAPVQAETKQPVQCTKGFIGIDDALFFGMAFVLIANGAISILKTFKRHDDEKAKQLKMPEQPAPDCKL